MQAQAKTIRACLRSHHVGTAALIDDAGAVNCAGAKTQRASKQELAVPEPGLATEFESAITPDARLVDRLARIRHEPARSLKCSNATTTNKEAGTQ